MGHGLCMFMYCNEHMSLHELNTFPPTCAALDGSDSSGGARWRVGPPVAHCDASLFLFLRAALLYGTHIAVAPHAEAAGHGQVQGIYSLWLQLTEHWFTHRLDLPIHLHLTHLQMRGNTQTYSFCAQKSRTKNTQKGVHITATDIIQTNTAPAKCRTKQRGQYIT